MTDEPLPPPQNLLALKVITGFLGLLLVGGFILLVVLLFTRGSGGDAPSLVAPRDRTLPPLVLQDGEVFAAAELSGGVAMITLRDGTGAGVTRLVFIDLSTGAQTVVPLGKGADRPVTEE
jgi:hypothetical protein